MPGQVDIANVALEILGKPAITSLLDNSNTARAINSTYDITRRSLLTGRATWRFSVIRASLPARSDAPASGPYTTWYDQPSDCLRVLLAGDTWPGLDLSDYRLGPTDAGYSVENGKILCDYGAPLSIMYVGDITDTSQFDARFVTFFAAELAYLNCERITNSSTKQADALKRKMEAQIQAVNANALVNPPQANADDTWIAARMQ